MKTVKNIFLMTSLLTMFSAYTLAQTPQKSDSTAQSSKKENSAYFLVQNEFVSKNVQRGMNFGNTPMNHIYLEGGNKHFAGYAWMNQDIHNLDTIAEVDVGFKYNKSIKLKENKEKKPIKLDVSADATVFTFPSSTTPNCYVLGANATITGLALTPKIEFKKGFVASSGFVVNTSLSKEYALTNNLSLNATIEAEHNNTFFTPGNDPIFAGASTTLTCSPIENLNVSGTFYVQTPLSKSHPDARKDGVIKFSATYNFK